MKDKTGIPRPWLYRSIRMGEAIGLSALLYGLASSEWLIAAAGTGVIMASYALYRRSFPVVSQRDEGSMGMSDGGD